MDLVYLDPPYNERQYSKNYFPLNMIAEDPLSSTTTTLKGKTGIPSNCFLSTLCQKKNVANSFDTIVANVKADWIVISYNSESLLSKERMENILKKYGTLTIIERPYKRFKSFEYNKDTDICEYLFILQKMSQRSPSA
jgi:adenine-specific DNA-methyltransferase